MQHVFVDFNSLMASEDGQVTINLEVEPNKGTVLHNGEHVLLSDEELAAEGVATWDAAQHLWLAWSDWATRQEREVLVAPTPVLGS